MTTDDEGVNESEMPKFKVPIIQDNVNGWGPCDIPEQFKDMPYQPFSKGDRLGKVSCLLSLVCEVYKVKDRALTVLRPYTFISCRTCTDIFVFFLDPLLLIHELDNRRGYQSQIRFSKLYFKLKLPHCLMKLFGILCHTLSTFIL